MTQVGTARIVGFDAVFIDPISNRRVERTQLDHEPLYWENFELLQPFQSRTFLLPFVERLNALVVKEFFADAREILGEYPGGFSLQAFSERDSREIERHSYPGGFSIDVLHHDSLYVPGYRAIAQEIWIKKYLPKVLECCSRAYREVLEPALPRELVESPYFGGISFAYRWIDAWQLPGQIVFTLDRTPGNIAEDHNILRGDIDRLLDTEILNSIQVPLDDLFRKIFLGTIFPGMIEAKIGLPASTDLEVAVRRDDPLGQYDSQVRLHVGIDLHLPQNGERLADFCRNKIRHEYRKLIYEEFAGFCRTQIFPRLEKLPPELAAHVTGMKYVIRKEFVPD